MRRRILEIGAGVLLTGVIVFLASCVSFAPFMIREAALPDGWPALTPVGQIQIKTYPVYRAATVTAADAGGRMEPMFNTLFGHIKSEGIAMTAPVEMGYQADDVPAGMTRMAFLYHSPRQGRTGADGIVQVADAEPGTFLSLGVRGAYDGVFIAKQVAKLKAWLAAQNVWQVSGPPRCLGYNSPFVPLFLRYAEVQIPIERTRADPAASPPGS